MFSVIVFLCLTLHVHHASAECATIDDINTTIWPDMWTLTSPNPDNPQAENKAEDVDPTILATAGVKYWKFDPSVYPYPNVSVPWEPEDTAALDPKLVAFREENGYNYADIITVRQLVPSFWDEHLHADPTIRYILNGSGYFDLRSVNDTWVRMHVKPGDMMEWPAGIFHRFTVDENNFITAMRLFQGSPVWTSYPREGDLYQQNASAVEARTDYESKYIDCNAGLAEDDVEEEGKAEASDESLGFKVGSKFTIITAFFLIIYHILLW